MLEILCFDGLRLAAGKALQKPVAPTRIMIMKRVVPIRAEHSSSKSL